MRGESSNFNIPPPRCWRQDKISIKAKLDYILNTEEDAYHDVTFCIGKEKEKFKAHKLILILGSPFFEDILNSKSAGPEISFSDVEPSAFRTVLKFIYTDKLDMQLDDAMPVLSAAQKFEIPELSARCTQMLRSNINDNNVVAILDSSKKNSVHELHDAALHYIIGNADRIFSSSKLLSVSYDNLCLILASDELQVDELKIFKQAIKWASEECKRFDMDENPENYRYLLKQAIYLIRFPLMNTEQFSEHVDPTGILSANETLELYRYYTLPQQAKLAMTSSNQMNFSSKRRTGGCSFGSLPNMRPSPFAPPQASSSFSQLTAAVSSMAVGSHRLPPQPMVINKWKQGFLNQHAQIYPNNPLSGSHGFNGDKLYRITNYSDKTFMTHYPVGNGSSRNVGSSNSSTSCYWRAMPDGADGFKLIPIIDETSSTAIALQKPIANERVSCQPTSSGLPGLRQWFSRSLGGEALFFIVNNHSQQVLQSNGNGRGITCVNENKNNMLQLWMLEEIDNFQYWS